MTKIQLVVPEGDVVAGVETIAASLGLGWMRSSLKKYPNSTHWHLVMPGQPGTLEVTWWPEKNRLWLSIHANREAPWQAEAMRAFQAEFQEPGPCKS